MLRNVLLVTLLICSASADDVSSTEDDLLKSDQSLGLADQHCVSGENGPGMCSVVMPEDFSVCQPELQAVNGVLTCYLCKEVVSYVKGKISSDTTVETIKKILYSVCDHLPGFKDTCKRFVCKYADKIAAIIQTADPGTVCKSIGVCN